MQTTPEPLELRQMKSGIVKYHDIPTDVFDLLFYLMELLKW
jgi:hypothetical protein